MQVEIFTVCRSAVANGHSISLLETFDTIVAKTFPATHSHLSIVLRVRFFDGESGEHSMNIRIIDPDGKAIYEAVPQVIHADPDALKSHLRNHIASVNDLEITKAGEFYAEAIIGEYEPFRVPIWVELESPSTQSPSM
jgi:hypothetical protein